jgi:S1-C subfamily serine protease
MIGCLDTFGGRGRRIRSAAIAFVVIGLLLGRPPVGAGADFRAAAKKLIPATVRITRVETGIRFETGNKKAEPAADASGNKKGAADLVANGDLTNGAVFLTGDGLRLARGLQFDFEVTKVSAVSLWCGVVVNADGWIATISDGRSDGKLEVALSDGRVLTAHIAVDDRRTGLVLLKADAKGLPVVPLANDPVEIGEDIVASIADGPKSRLIARGIVTAVGRHAGNGGPLLIQSDLPRSEGAGGVPVGNSSGDLVGLVSTASGPGNATFVIPVTHVKSLLAAPGLVLQAPSPARPIVIESGVMGITLHGQLLLGDVHADRPAAKAGLQKGDEIVAIDRRSFASTDELTDYTHMQTPGTKLTVKYRRGGKELSADVVLAPPEKPKSDSESPIPAIADGAETIYVWNAQAPVNLQTPLNLSAGPNANGIIFTPVAGGIVNFATPPVMRVEKTDAEKRIDELSSDVKSLQGGIDALRSQMEALNKHLKDLTKTLKKN